MSGDIFDEWPDPAKDTLHFGDQTLPPPLVGTSLAEPVIDEVATTLSPLVERAAIACDSLRDAVARAVPTEANLRETLSQITDLVDRADRLVAHLEPRRMTPAIDADPSAANAADTLRAMVDTAVENLGTRTQMQLDLMRAEIDALANEVGGRLDALTARLDEIAPRAGKQEAASAVEPPLSPSAGDLDAAMAQSLTAWETQVAELLRLFRDKAEQVTANVERVGRGQARELDALCARAERLLTAPGRDAANIVEMLDEVVHTIEPWRGLLVEGKCGPEISPVIGAIVERVRSEIPDSTVRPGSTGDGPPSDDAAPGHARPKARSRPASGAAKAKPVKGKHAR